MNLISCVSTGGNETVGAMLEGENPSGFEAGAGGLQSGVQGGAGGVQTALGGAPSGGSEAQLGAGNVQMGIDDQTLALDACNLQFLYQAFDSSVEYSNYNAIPWRLGLLTAER